MQPESAIDTTDMSWSATSTDIPVDNRSSVHVENVTDIVLDVALNPALKPGTQPACWIFILFAAICLLVAMFVLVCNAVFVTACWRTRALRTLSTLHVISLAGSDMLQGVGMLLQALFYAKMCIGSFLWHGSLCSLLQALFFTCMPISIISIAFIAIDRYVYIIYPYRYPTVVTAKKSKIAIAVAWACCAMFGLSIMFQFVSIIMIALGWACCAILGLSIMFPGEKSSEHECKTRNTVHTFYIWSRLITFLASSVVSGFCHISIQVVAMRHIRQVHAGPPVTKMSHLSRGSSTLKGMTVASLRLAKTFFLVYVSQLICWTPALVVMVLNLPYGGLNNAVILLAELNAALNVLVYVFSNHQFRRAIMDLLRCYRKGGVYPSRNLSFHNGW
ncbi:LOW QUALITY PROTEIN: D(1a) dopamine receptor [Plakobranchus ocellatus]|uniref:D(1a) dopamine receptor n=1 Tax=Plakobranchus ocellatus TaxID=259542 RepID=A0AAV3YW91_9GAST|nr:LOW QUALITY PROTEIN: D(1a) dopamine receptor [Plakobranchus ocellatus]